MDESTRSVNEPEQGNIQRKQTMLLDRARRLAVIVIAAIAILVGLAEGADVHPVRLVWQGDNLLTELGSNESSFLYERETALFVLEREGSASQAVRMTTWIERTGRTVYFVEVGNRYDADPSVGPWCSTTGVIRSAGDGRFSFGNGQVPRAWGKSIAGTNPEGFPEGCEIHPTQTTAELFSGTFSLTAKDSTIEVITEEGEVFTLVVETEGI